MSKTSIIIRNVSGLCLDDIQSIINLSGLGQYLKTTDPHAAPIIQRFQEAVIEGKVYSELIMCEEVRDYLYEFTKAHTGHHLILHLNHNLEDTEAYILPKLASIDDNTTVNVFYLGGGHGGGSGDSIDDETSGLQKNTVLEIHNLLSVKRIVAGAAIFGSCYSGAFTNNFRDVLVPDTESPRPPVETSIADVFRSILIEDGVMLSDSVECNLPCFIELVRWLTDPNDIDFFSSDEIQGSVASIEDQKLRYLELIGTIDELKIQRIKFAYNNLNHQEITEEDLQLELRRDVGLEGSLLDHFSEMLKDEITKLSDRLTEYNTTLSWEDLKRLAEDCPIIHNDINYLEKHSVYEAGYDDFFERLKDEASPNTDPRDTGDCLFCSLEDSFKESCNDIGCLRIIAYVCKYYAYGYESTLGEILADKENIVSYMNNLKIYPPLPDPPPQVPMFESKDVLLRALQQSFQKSKVTGKIISSRTSSILLELTNATGAPAQCHADAFARVKMVIQLLGDNKEAGVHVKLVQSVSQLNQTSIMLAFNEAFKQAMAAVSSLQAVHPEHAGPSALI